MMIESFEKFQNERNSISVGDLDLRTTSQIEALNSTIQRTFPSSPSIFTFIQNLRLFDCIKSTDLHQLHLSVFTNQEKKKNAWKINNGMTIIMADKNIIHLSDGTKICKFSIIFYYLYLFEISSETNVTQGEQQEQID